MDTSMHIRVMVEQELNYIVYSVFVREKAKIHRSCERVLNGLVVGILYTMWFNSIVPPLHGFCVCMDVSI
jgi:hypothetical protein